MNMKSNTASMLAIFSAARFYCADVRVHWRWKGMVKKKNTRLQEVKTHKEERNSLVSEAGAKRRRTCKHSFPMDSNGLARVRAGTSSRLRSMASSRLCLGTTTEQEKVRDM